MDQHQDRSHAQSLGGQAVQPQCKGHGQYDGDTAKAADHIGELHHLFGIVLRLVKIACAHQAAHHSNDGLAGEHAHAVQVIGNGIGGNLGGSEHGDDAHHQHTAQLEDTVLDPVWYPNI